MGLTRVLFMGVISLMCFNAALALDINQANEAELDSVKGMGPALSAKVLKAREEGAFKNWADLMKRVSGIRQNKAKQFSEQGLTVDGQAFAKKP
jgi:competence protein ComEA